jgi:hypothetical protein
MVDIAAAGSPQRFWGKYRGRVINNADPERRGRVQVVVPEVLGASVSIWAMPCSPYAGDGVGLFVLPPVGASVWVEFEAGNLNHAILAGCFWASGEVPIGAGDPGILVLKTAAGLIRIDDQAGEIRIETQGATITLAAGEVTVEAGTVTQSANGARAVLSAGGFDVLQGALKVT